MPEDRPGFEFDFETDAREREKAAREVVEAYERLFARADGKIVLADLIEFGHILAPTFRAGEPDVVNYEQGKQRAVLRILRFSGWEVKIKELIKEG